jgi:probable rRNA maturation factor
VELIINNHQPTKLPENMEEMLKSLLEYTLELESIEGEREVGITFVDDGEIQSLNRDYRGKDQVTDVLSFAMNDTLDDEPIILDEDQSLLGDIVIDYDRALMQAEEYGHSPLREVCYLSLHGMLHLLGYDHEVEEDKNCMRKREEEILAEYQITREL